MNERTREKEKEIGKKRRRRRRRRREVQREIEKKKQFCLLSINAKVLLTLERSEEDDEDKVYSKQSTTMLMLHQPHHYQQMALRKEMGRTLIFEDFVSLSDATEKQQQQPPQDCISPVMCRYKQRFFFVFFVVAPLASIRQIARIIIQLYPLVSYSDTSARMHIVHLITVYSQFYR